MDKEKKFFLALTFRYSFALGLLAILSLTSYFILKENIRAEEITNLESLQFSILMVTIFVLILAGVFLFRPMVKRIKEKSEELQKQGAALFGANERLQKEINECKELERQLCVVNEFDKTLLKTLPFGIDIVDEDGSILYLNKKMEQAFGRESLGMKCYALYKDDKKQCVNCPLKNGVRMGETRSIEVAEAMMGGRTFLITHTGMTYHGKKAILEVFEDITDYKKVQAEFALSERLAVIGRMAGVIAHEFRNQLGVIRNAAYFLKMKMDAKDGKVARHLEILDEQIGETERIIENILTFSRTSSPQLQRVDARNLLKASLDKIKIPEGIKVNIGALTLPPIEVDPLQLGGVFFNIILNAVQAMGDKGALCIEGTKADNHVILTFKDTGGGIKEEDKKRIFEPFFSTKPRGTGLGLATAKIIIEKHKGAISVESEYGQGTTVIIRLPTGANV